MEMNLIWAHLLEPGLEHLHFYKGDNAIIINSLVVGLAENEPFRMQYEILCDMAWQVRKIRLTTINGVKKSLELESDGNGNWIDGKGTEMTSLRGCLNLDISATPFTTGLAISQLELSEGDNAEIKVAYITIPDLTIRPIKQKYAFMETRKHNRIYHYEGPVKGQTAEFYLDEAGMVTDYPGTFIRVWPRSYNQQQSSRNQTKTETRLCRDIDMALNLDTLGECSYPLDLTAAL